MDKNRPASAASQPGPMASGGRKSKPRVAADAAERPARFEMSSEFLQGRILIAMPAIGDPRFERSVALICGHDAEHAMAIVLNRPLEGLSVPGLLDRLGLASEGLPDTPVLNGGPVERERGYVLHSDDYVSSGSTIQVTDGIALTDTREVLDALGDEQRRPRRALLALGYAGWGAGQLESELRQGVWLTCDADEELLFDPDHASKWTRALAKIGVSPDRLSSQAGRA
jgi:putative transcriptional regulator